MEIDQQRLQDTDYRAAVLTALLQEYQDGIYRYCVARLGDGVGEEIAQEVFVTAWETLPKFRQQAAPSTWLFGIAKYKCMQALRNRTRRAKIMAEYLGNIRRHVHREGLEAAEARREEQAQLTRLTENVAQLRDAQRMIVILHYITGLPITEIAEIAGKSEAAVRKGLRRALQRLRDMDDGPTR